MTFHKVRAKNPRGHRPNKAKGQKCSPRLATSFDPLVWKAILFLAKRRDLPAAQIVRDGMWAYTKPLLYDLAAGREPNFEVASDKRSIPISGAGAKALAGRAGGH